MSPGVKRAYDTISKAYELPVTTSAAPSKPSAKKKCDRNSKAVAKRKNNRHLYYDCNIKDSSSWSKLLSRHIKGDRVKQTVSTYAFDAFNVHRIVSVDKRDPVTGKRNRHKNNGTTRAFKCETCPPDSLWRGWSVMLRRVTDKKQNLWCVVPCVGNENPLTTKILCDCRKSKKLSISDQVFLNAKCTREFVSQHPMSTANVISKEIESHHIAKCAWGEDDAKLPSEPHRKPAIDILLTHEIDKLRQRYQALPDFLVSLIEKNGGFNHCNSVSVALQGTQTSHSQPRSNFCRAFVGHPVTCLGHSLHLPVLFVDCCHYQCPH